MQMLELDPAEPLARIRFRGKVFLISKADFREFQRRRYMRICGGEAAQFKSFNGVDPLDHFAEKREELVDGGEVCPFEMSKMVGGQHQTMWTLFGQHWQDIKRTGWKAES